ncbi:uncharacterized protein LOC133525261 isoform X1 [Cydia pomonella]|uniref:uncharacterized protein LOC133525261 isoform X1 n=1 Tax=Cydia pomonella TaxID=82600 RepID=UPI002ADDF82B|nr:uncharacterized protein LOC133525261 isoform X1 [Cydia pomonella]
MSNNSETETDTENQPPNKIRRIPNKTFNDMAKAASTSSLSFPLPKTQSTDHKQCITPTRKRPLQSNALNIHQDASSEANDLQIISINEKDLIFGPVSLQEQLEENEGTVLVTETQSKSVLDEIESLKLDIETVKNGIQTVAENQSVLSNNQTTIIAQISELSIKLEEFIKLSLGTKKNPDESGSIKIYNEENLQEFERKLEQPDSRNDLYRQYSVILNEGVGKGRTNAYTLVDAMFDRKFFMQCSWTGVSKGDATKVCFKGFKNTINFFFNIVHESDNTFTKAQLIKFFKTILRNARYRSESEQMRMCGQRHKKRGKLQQKSSLSTSLHDNLEKSSSDQNQRELPDLESETNLQSVRVTALQENEQNKSANGDDEEVDNTRS